MRDKYALIGRVEEEDEGDDGMPSLGISGNEVSGRADRLEREEEEHSRRGCQEQLAPTDTFDHERRENRPDQIPDGQNTVRRR